MTQAWYRIHTSPVYEFKDELRDFEAYVIELTRVPYPTAQPMVTPSEQLRAIESELEIIRGRVPTPRGYVCTPSRIKDLLRQWQTLIDGGH